jgi:uroporphyrinogen-III decarboxylase
MLIKPDNWDELPFEEKRKIRLDYWQSADGITFENSEAEAKFKERTGLFRAAYEMRKGSRVPSSPMVGSYLYKRLGLTEWDMLYDTEKLAAAGEKIVEFHKEFDPDAAIFNLAVPGKVLDILDYRIYVWAGHGIAKERPYQTVEGEYMMADEYPELIRDPTGFFLNKYLPRACGLLDPLQHLPNLPLQTEIIGVALGAMSFSTPPMRKMLNKLMEAGDETMKFMGVTMQSNARLSAMGYAGTMGSFCKAPFDEIGDTLRGTRGIITDLYRQPDNVLAACDRYLEISLPNAIKACDSAGGAFCTFPLHKGADGFMSQEQFEKFYWPTLRALMEGLNEEGIIPVLFAEGGYNSRLETIADYPRGRAVWYFDKSDMRLVKDILGDVATIEGNIPTSLMSTGSPDQLRAYCEELLEIYDDGGFILTNGAMADKTTDEHVRTIIDVVRQ